MGIEQLRGNEVIQFQPSRETGMSCDYLNFFIGIVMSYQWPPRRGQAINFDEFPKLLAGIQRYDDFVRQKIADINGYYRKDPGQEQLSAETFLAATSPGRLQRLDRIVRWMHARAKRPVQMSDLRRISWVCMVGYRLVAGDSHTEDVKGFSLEDP